jgi:hypothetical protein
MASANFTINATAVPPALAVSASTTVTLALVSTTGVRLVEWSIVGNHSSAQVNPTITPAGSPLGATATFAMPSGAGQAYLIQCVVNGGNDENGRAVSTLTKRALVGVNTTAGDLPFAVGETDERSLTHGYTEALNRQRILGTGDVTGPPSSTVGRLALWDDTSGTTIDDGGLDLADIGHQFNIVSYGAVAGTGASAATNVTAIQDAIDDAVAAGKGDVVFPGPPGTVYNINAGLTISGSNIKLVFPGGAKLRLTGAVPVVFAVGDIETNVTLGEGNLLASDAAESASSVVLAAGKGANFAAGGWYVIISDAVVPEHDAAVVNQRAEFINVYSVSVDTLTLSSPLRYSYATADNAEVYRVDWIEGFAIEGLGIDGNSQQACSVAVQMSWCLEPTISGVVATDLQQRFLRFQGCRGARVTGLRQSNGLSNGFQGDSGHFAYSIIESGLNEGLIASDLHIDRCRHGYSTGAGWTDNDAVTSAIITGVGVPMNSEIGPGVHTNARGTGWDTHEVGVDITFRNCQTLGGLYLGFTTRSVRTRYVNCFARDTIAAALQIGDDAQDTIVESLDWKNTNLGTDEDTSTDWTVLSPISDNSARTYLGRPAPNLIDNGGFDIWDRNSSFTATGGTANRWKLTLGTGAAATISRQTHPVPSVMKDAGRYYLRFDRTTTGSSESSLAQYIDDVRSLAGQRVVISFDSRTDTPGTLLRVFLRQYFGTGGSPSGNVDSTIYSRSLDTDWQRHTVIIDVPSISGKTIGSNADSALLLFFELPTAAGTPFFDLDRVKLEIGRTPTTFVPESPAATRERCARWYQKSYVDGQNPGSASSSGNVRFADSVANENYYKRTVFFSARMGRAPTITFYAPSTGTVAKARNLTANTDVDAETDNIGQSSFHGGVANSGDVTGGDVCAFSWTAAVADFE